MEEKSLEALVLETAESFPDMSQFPVKKEPDPKMMIDTSLDSSSHWTVVKETFYHLLEEIFDVWGADVEQDFFDKYYSTYSNWERTVMDVWVKRDLFKCYVAKYPITRTYEDVAKIYADRWVELIFKQVVQSNGDETGQSAQMLMFGTLVKSQCQSKVSQEQIEKFRQLCYDRVVRFRSGYLQMSCDYGPDRALYDLLESSGIDTDDIQFICPWKTSLAIDYTDMSVIEKHYRERKII